MSIAPFNPTLVRQLVIKDWQIYQKQLAGYAAGLLLALALIGLGKPWSASSGFLLLLILMVVMGSYAIQTSLITERKEQTVAFVMSLPVTPADFYWGKLLGNLLIYLVPFSAVAVAITCLVITTPLPDGLLVYMWLVLGFLLMTFIITLCAAITLESEGWIIFVMMSLMALIGPFIYAVGTIDAIARTMKTDNIVFSPQAMGVFAAELLLVLAAMAVASGFHGRKTSFL